MEVSFMSKLKIIIVADNTNWEYTRGCINSLAMDTNEIDLIVVNNGTPLEKEYLPDYVDYINNSTREPYGKVINDALHTRGFNTDIVLLNPEIRCKREDILYLKMMAYNSASAGIVFASNKTRGQVITPDRGIVYITKHANDCYGLFDKRLITEEATLLNASLQLMCQEKLLTYEIGGLNYIHEVFTETNEADLEHDRDVMESIWGMKYFNTLGNSNIIQALTPYINSNRDKNDSIKIMEFGCDLGATLLEAKKRFSQYCNIHTLGVEVNHYAAEIADGNTVDYIIELDIEKLQENHLKKQSIDFIIFGDVLEHLTHPERILKLCKYWLKPNGKIIASIPNLMHISAMKELVKGNFSYTDRGLLDRTHCHLFTRKEIIKMFEDTGYKVNMKSLETSVTTDERSLIRTLVRLSGGETNDSDYTTFQYLCTVTPKQ